ncbi:hypothetical protein [Paenibacillus sp. S25]|uniref:hypothetical protein n=1 Tax=Paenibacillus sp. S25 TaxID=2823905 RepID=UPI001C64F0A6|nr:hypothetical protein [Paenibacillus sp. S25]QYK61861.1 hypothetical protein KAI37_02185 [Paenibacillus sp. S25]
MGMFHAPQVVAQTTHDQLLDLFARVVKELEFIVNGAIDSKNVREIGGYNVNKTELQSKDGAVGLSSARTDEDDLRIWAGDPDRAKAAFKVFESGLVTLTKFLLSSTDGAFPKIEMGSEGNILAAFSSADHYIAIDPNYAGTPALKWIFNGTSRGGINDVTGLIELFGVGGLLLRVIGGDLDITADKVKFENWNRLYNRSTSRTLQQDLSEIFDRLEALEGS